MQNIKIKGKNLELYKRENSKIWQIKIKLPFKKAIRVSSGSLILKEAKIIANKKYEYLNLDNLKNISNKKKYVFKKINLIKSKDLNKKEIQCFLNESDKYIDFNKKNIKKSKILNGRTIFNLFFEDSTRTRTSFEVAAKRLGADLINVALKDSSIKNIGL